MANREALRDLQSRLSGRLQAARNEGVQVAAWLAVQAGGRGYLLPLSQSGEIFPWTGVQPVPYTKPWFLGIANLRGTLSGVADLAELLGHACPRSEVQLAESSLLGLNAALEVNAALLVDKLQGLRAASDFVHAERPKETASAFLGPVHVDASGQHWQELNLQQLSQAAEFLNIRA
ncbi:chemotaxis protein CheW [Comamonas composti]|uniref:chemotaxis protein CheW n=1 Tax=Comamonas composti TaxID=408558 RepID=UPI0004106CC9|nr:chemotaxis protein CheW [Comamonas composti]